MSIIKNFLQMQADFKVMLTHTLQDTIKDAVTAALCSQSPPPIHRMYHEVPDTTKASQDTGKGKYREFSGPTKLGSADRSESSENHVKIESPTSETHLSGAGTGLLLSGHSARSLDPLTSIPLPRPAETEEEKEERKMEQFAELVGCAFCTLLQEAIRSISQTPGPATSKSKIPAPENPSS
jgi:hypothetical protein